MDNGSLNIENIKKEGESGRFSQRKTIVVVDDISFSLVTAKGILKDKYEVYPAKSVDAMFKVLEKVEADLILLDINMPQVNGYDALRELKADKRYAHIPVVILSSSADKQSIVKGISMGAVDHIPKPFSAPYLLERIEHHLRGGGRSDELSVDGISEEDRNKPCILAVDDSPSMLRSVYYALHDKYRVHTIPTPESVKSFLQKTTPDLFLLDYKMPGIDGFELVSVIREHPEHKDTPIIFLTTEGSVDTLAEAVELGAADFVVKPFHTDSLRQKIEEQLRGRL